MRGAVVLAVHFILMTVGRVGFAADGFNLEYVRRSGVKFETECTVSYQKTVDGYVFQSVTRRPKETMRLTLRQDTQRRLQTAELEQETASGKHAATARFDKNKVVVKRLEEKEQEVALAAEAVFATTAPDWSDILLVLRRYDHKQGGKQEFVGLWFHPVKPPLSLTVVVVELGKDTINEGDKRLTLTRYRVQLRSGAYLVWADDQGKVFKLTPGGQPQGAVMLKGQETIAARLGDS